MASHYDAIIKTILNDAKSLFAHTLTKITSGTPLPNDAGWFTGRTVDFVSKVNEKLYVHIEIQTKNDETMHWRMVNYFTLLNHKIHQWAEDDVIIKQFLVYIGPGMTRMRKSHPSFGQPYGYETVDLSTREPGRLKSSPLFGDRVLALLMAGSTEDDWRSAVRSACRLRLDSAILENLFFILHLSKLRGMHKVVEDAIVEMGMYEALHNTPLTARAAEQNSVGTIIDLISEYYLDENQAALTEEERECLEEMRLSTVKTVHKAITRRGAPRSYIQAAAIMTNHGSSPKI